MRTRLKKRCGMCRKPIVRGSCACDFPAHRGTLYQRDKMFFRSAAGEATGKDGTVYELTTTVNDGSPLVRSSKSGRTFHLRWQDVIDLALEAGLDAPTEAHGQICATDPCEDCQAKDAKKKAVRT